VQSHRGVVRSCDPLQYFGAHEPKVVKFCTQIGYINSMQQDDILPTKGRGYGHVTFLNLAVCRDAARRAGLSATAELHVLTALLEAWCHVTTVDADC